MKNSPSQDLLFMQECLRLAEQGRGKVSPNPLVGCVIVKHGRVIGQGYHAYFGGPHAEVNAISSAEDSVKGATLYTNLEPCNHTGKTPPCTDLIISSGIKRVVVGMKDPNLMMSGKSLTYLKKNGIDVTSGICEKESADVNRGYDKFIRTGIPFVTLKIAQTLDAKIAHANGRFGWITSPASRTYVHSLRTEHDAVLVGAGTVLHDNPRLTVRHTEGKNPVRVILDGRFRCHPAARVFSNAKIEQPIIITSERYTKSQQHKKMMFQRNGVRIFERYSNRNDGMLLLRDVLPTLATLGITSVLVEGGASIFSGMMRGRLVDRVECFIAPKIFGEGRDTFSEMQNLHGKVSFHTVSYRQFDNDILLTGVPQYS